MTTLLDILYALRARLRAWWGRRFPAPITPELEAAYYHHNQIMPAQRFALIAAYRWWLKEPRPDGVRRFGIYGQAGQEPDLWEWPTHLLPFSPALSANCREYGYGRLFASILPALQGLCAKEGHKIPQWADMLALHGEVIAAIPGFVDGSIQQRNKTIQEIAYHPALVQQIDRAALEAQFHPGPVEHARNLPPLPLYTIPAHP